MNEQNSQSQNKSNRNRNKDDYQDKQNLSRMGKAHGGEVLLSISPEDLVQINDIEHEHNWVKDETEELGNAFICTVENCGQVRIFQK